MKFFIILLATIITSSCFAANPPQSAPVTIHAPVQKNVAPAKAITPPARPNVYQRFKSTIRQDVQKLRKEIKINTPACNFTQPSSPNTSPPLTRCNTRTNAPGN